MKLYRLNDNRFWKAAFALYMLALLMLCRDSMAAYALLGFYKTQIIMLGILALGVLTVAIAKLRDLKAIFTDRRMIAVIASAVLILLPMVIKRDWQMMYFSVLICLFFAIFLSYFLTLKEVAKYYVLILCALSLYSIFATYVLRILPDRGLLDVQVFAHEKGRTFYNLWFCFPSIVDVKFRNFGIFREPGVYQFFIMVALYLINYTVEWKKESHMWAANILMAVTMLTTMATGGVIELGLFVIVVFFEKKLYKDKRIRILAIVLVVAMCLVVLVSFIQKNLIYELIYENLIEKFVKKTDSVTERAEAIQVDLEIFFRSPVFGARLADVLHAVENNTTSTLILYAVFGAVSGSLNVLAWFALVWEKKRSFWWNGALLVILFMSFNTQNLIADVFFWLFPMMALCERGLPLLKLPKKG